MDTDTAEDMQEDLTPAGAAGSFDSLPVQFLQDVQTALEGLGFDLS